MIPFDGDRSLTLRWLVTAHNNCRNVQQSYTAHEVSFFQSLTPWFAYWEVPSGGYGFQLFASRQLPILHHLFAKPLDQRIGYLEFLGDEVVRDVVLPRQDLDDVVGIGFTSTTLLDPLIV
jgi:hypothetical protein